MGKINISSNITFLYFKDLAASKTFFQETLGLEVAYDPGWATVYHLGQKSFIGAVDDGKGSIEISQKGGVLVSLTVHNIEEVYQDLLQKTDITGLSPIKNVKDLALTSFFFTGPEGYQFEIQQFTSGELKEIF